jgi:hypothetical protein
MLIRTLNVAAKSASHSRKGLEGVAFAVTKLMADTRDPESFETSEPPKKSNAIVVAATPRRILV